MVTSFTKLDVKDVIRTSLDQADTILDVLPAWKKGCTPIKNAFWMSIIAIKIFIYIFFRALDIYLCHSRLCLSIRLKEKALVKCKFLNNISGRNLSRTWIRYNQVFCFIYCLDKGVFSPFFPFNLDVGWFPIDIYTYYMYTIFLSFLTGVYPVYFVRTGCLYRILAYFICFPLIQT